jgi:hypothetical protein
MAHRKAAISRATAAITTGSFFAGGAEPAIAGAQPDLRLPGDVADRLRQALEPASQGLANAGRKAIAPGGFDQDPPGATVASEGEAGASHHVTGRPLARDQAEKRHQLPRIVETAQIADLGGDGHRHQKRSAAHGLISFHDRRHRPVRHDRDKLLLQPPQPRHCFLYRLDCCAGCAKLWPASQRRCARVQC